MHETQTERRLAAILVTDIVGYSRLMAGDEEGTLAAMKSMRDSLAEPRVRSGGGRIVKRSGDGTLVEFSSIVEAVRVAIDVQRALAESNVDAAIPLLLRIGVHLGDILVDTDGDIYGDGVNIAARLENLCAPGEILLSGAAWEQVKGRIDAHAEALGRRQLKNIPIAVDLHRLIPVEGLEKTLEADPDKMAMALPQKPSIVVLPFENLSANPEQDFFCDGLVEDVISALSRFNSLFVIARNTSFTYRSRAVNVRDVSRELGVQYVLEGSVRRADDRVRVAAQLIDAVADRHIWAERWDREMADLFAVQDEMTEVIVMSIAPHIQSEEMDRARRGSAHSLGTWEKLARAQWYLARFTKPDNTVAREILDEVLADNPANVDALAAQALCDVYEQIYWSPGAAVSFDVAVSQARMAVSLAPDNENAQAYLGLALWFAREHDDSRYHLEKAFSLNPNSSLAVGLLGRVCVWTHDFKTALTMLRHALRLSPRDPWAGFYEAHLGLIALFSDDLEKAVRHGEEALRLMPQAPSPLIFLASAYGLRGDGARAMAMYQRIRALLPNASISTVKATFPYVFEEDVDLICQGLRRAGMPE